MFSSQILIYRRGALGDTLFLFPLFETLKRKGFFIRAIGNTDYLILAKKLGWVDEIYTEPFPEIVNQNYFKKLIFSKEHINPFPKKRCWLLSYYEEILQSILGISLHYSQILPIEPHSESPFKNKVVLHPGSGSFKKNPPLELFLKIQFFLEKRGYSVVYFQGIAENWLENKVKPVFKSKDLGKDIVEIAKHLKTACLFIGNDSGISHLSSYLGVKTFLFFGPTDSVIWKPIGKDYQIISGNFKCAPCFPNTCENRPCLSEDLLFNLFVSYFSKFNL